ncbi:MAG: YjjG family noncanonical pyrimidine nucleotidase [Oscillospiraceae bacterium]|nr:YjjG family noncanonical pyrimidine nucleotidase [Oscillospiraceae bacterium]
MPKVILFDVDNTLLSFDQCVKETMKLGFEKFSIGTYEDWMFSVFNRINAELWRSIEQEEIDFEELKQVRWNKIFHCLNFSADGVLFEKYFRDCLFESAIPEKGAMDLLEYLCGKYTLCVASNGPYLQQINRLKKSGMLPLFFDLFVSEEIGSSKPSPEFFGSCIARLNQKTGQNIQPCEVMMIGDSLSSDMAGAAAFGMQTCFYNPENKPIPSEIKISYCISSLTQIKSFL